MRMGELLGRVRPPRRPRTAKPLPEPATGHGLQESDLAVRREWLARQYAEMQSDLGGLTYEMAIRDHFRLDVLVRHAARLQEIDAELAEVERQLHLDEAGAAGSCAACGALFARGAVFCWQCGKDLLPRASITAAQGRQVAPQATEPPAAPDTSQAPAPPPGVGGQPSQLMGAPPQ